MYLLNAIGTSLISFLRQSIKSHLLMNSSFELSYRKNSFLPEGCDHIIPNSVRSSSSDVSLSKFVCPSEKNILFCNLKGIQLQQIKTGFKSFLKI